ncbi:MAG: hypothetical protein P1P82_02465 [Bacteroidales bacterium]|nr:hypothetical protein [Bacteroidales bacterium]MDT8431092.1 hypothetical protein [Bacteroidales bacterium]
MTQIIGPNDTLSVTFDTGIKERIDSKTDAGADYIHSALNKFQMESIDSATNALAGRPDMHLSYTSFNKVDTISEGEYLLTFDYGPNQEPMNPLNYNRYTYCLNNPLIYTGLSGFDR